MTTRAGLVGLLTGLTVTLILIYPLTGSRTTGSGLWNWLALAVGMLLTSGGGALAARWSGSGQPWRCAALGALTGGLTGVLVFCLLGAAAAGEINPQAPGIEALAALVRRTQAVFLICFLGGGGLGTLGGWLVCPCAHRRTEIFDKSAPQMALNVAITAVPASIVAAATAAAVFSRLAELAGRQMPPAALVRSILDWPLSVALLLVLLAQLALTLVLPHEARQAEHLCGLDEVKMAAWVGMGAFPVLSLLLYLVHAALFATPLVLAALLVSGGLSLRSWQTLRRQILPKRASFTLPRENWQKTEAKWFGTIAQSRGSRLAVLCLGCGLTMILPLHVTVVSVLINLNSLLIDPQAARHLFLTQALVSSGLMTASAALLIVIYLFYLNLGRWFNRRVSPRPRQG